MADTSELSDPSTCPLCGEPNQCGVAAGSTQCWCFTATVPDAVLARIPAEDQNRRCVCERCATAPPAAAENREQES